MPITSTHSFHCKALGLEATAYDLGDLGASLCLTTSDDHNTPITLFLDDLEYAKALTEAINSVGRRFFLEAEAA